MLTLLFIAAFTQNDVVALTPNIHIERVASAEERQRVLGLEQTARATLELALGRLQTERPLAIFCKTEPCRLFFSGVAQRSWTLAAGDSVPGAIFKASRLTVIVTEVGPRSLGLLAHELVHAELHARGVVFPAWFNEGLAAAISDAPKCEPNLPPGIDDLRKLSRNGAWQQYTAQKDKIHTTYCQARTAVEAFLSRYGREHTAATIRLFSDALKHGVKFEQLFGDESPAPAFTMRDMVLSFDGLSSLLMMEAFSLADASAFSISAWVKSEQTRGVIAHASSSPDGTGWCTPIMGYDADGKLAAQLPDGTGEESFTIVRAPLPQAKWTHVVMTWAPGGMQRLYVGGKKVAETKAQRYGSAGKGSPLYLTWGSANERGATGCWKGVVEPVSFKGEMRNLKVEAREWSEADIASMQTAP